MQKDIDLQKISGLLGILSPVVGLTSIGIAILLLPWFSWTENYLSDLGGSPESDCLWGTHGYASVIFNFGLVTAGALGIAFGMGLRQSGFFKTKFGSLGTFLFMLDACMLVGVGLFSESTGAPHSIFSLAFFVLIGFALFFLGISLLKSHQKREGWFVMGLFVFGLCAIPLFMVDKPLGQNAVAEMMPIISASAFSIVFGFRLFVGQKDDVKAINEPVS